jgi:phosphoenolpyruvate-protein phosphotransferase
VLEWRAMNGKESNAMSPINRSRPLTLNGKRLVDGMGKGRAFVYRRDRFEHYDECYDIKTVQIEPEKSRFEETSRRVSDQLRDLANQVKHELDDELSEIFHAHALILQDQALVKEVKREIEKEMVSAGSAVRTVFRRWERRFHEMEADISSMKSDDMRDLAHRLILSLAGVHSHDLERMPEGAVVVSRRLLPSEMIVIADKKVAAVLLEEGGAGSHAVLFAHEMGLPCISGLAGVAAIIQPDEFVLADACQGTVVVEPDQATLDQFDRRCEHIEEEKRLARVQAAEPAQAPQGKVIPVLANVGSKADVEMAIENGADGIGLYRIELAYLGRPRPPTSAELEALLEQAIEPAKSLPVYLRLLDVGADKPLPYLKTPHEINPSLGRRGVRFLQHYPEYFEIQIETILNLFSRFDLRILIPMVTLPSDIIWVREGLQHAAEKRGYSSTPPLGIMIETPAAALTAPALAPYADFISFGTNDLTQYLFAADRNNAGVDFYFDDEHPLLFDLFRRVREQLPDMTLSICGELASRTAFTAKLIQCGIDSLSVAAASIPVVKQAVREMPNC